MGIGGEGGLEMVMEELGRGVEYDLGLSVFVVNNKELGLIKYEQEGGG
ncbi:thiamine pyrophosphate-dependent enzyme, partial [Staphylococcus aureus]